MGTTDSPSYPHTFSALNGPTGPKTHFLIFYSNVVNGKMWCPVSLAYEWPSCALIADCDVFRTAAMSRTL